MLAILKYLKFNGNGSVSSVAVIPHHGLDVGCDYEDPVINYGEKTV